MRDLPWYRQPWVWFVIALPAIAVVGSVVLLILALRFGDEVVERDYYQRGLSINKELAPRDHAADTGAPTRGSRN